MSLNDIKHLAVETIYLVPDASEGQRCYLWCDDPAPGEGMDASEAVEYVRKDVHEAIIAKQAKAAIRGMDAAKKVAGSNLEQAKRLHAESSPEALESEREANARLTELVTQLERDRDDYRADEELQLALLRSIQEERDALARMQKFVLIFSASCRMADTDDCIEWQGNKDAKGYGRIHGAGGTVKAHRLAYCLHTQCTLESVSGDVIRHTCDNPGCVNPRHLLIGSNLDNIADRVERDRSAKGEGNGWAKLTSEDVAQIKAFYQKGVRGRGAVSTAKRFNVCHSTVQRIISGERWAHHEDA